MSFCSFSKEFTANMFTCVENQFITKYLPQTDGDAVRVYLYGLYLCSCKEAFDAENVAKLLKLKKEDLVRIYDFWEECDLVRVLSREPLFVEYLPVNAAVGKPKSIRPEKYSDFNRELLRRLQRAGKDFKPYEMQKILEFLENNEMEQSAFLLVAEYCIKKDGEKVSCAHILNKAKKLCENRKYTYEQVENEFSDFNRNESTLEKVFSLLGILRKAQDSDYELLEKWLQDGFETGAILAMAGALKKGTLKTLDVLAAELAEKKVRTASEAKEYLQRREELAAVIYRVARKLGVSVQNPRAYIEEYAEKWLERGYDEESLLTVAGLCFKLRYGFPEMDALLESLYLGGIVDGLGVKQYCAVREKQLRLLQSVQSACGVLKKTQVTLDMVAAWQSWNFSDAMILEAAKRSAEAAAPLSYMNKLLSEWKREGIFSVDEIPEKTFAQDRGKSEFKSETAIAADRRSDREHHYAVLRQSAIARAEENRKRAEADEAFKSAEGAVKRGEIALAKAEVYSPETVPSLQTELREHRAARLAALKRLGLSEEDLSPAFSCPKCSDTGYLPDGRLCDCYKG